MLGKKHPYKRTITSLHRLKMIKMETDIIMESHKNIQSTSASTLFSENTLQNENVHDSIENNIHNEFENVLHEDLVSNESENISCDEELISNEFENVLCNNDEDVVSNEFENVLRNENLISSEYEFSDENSRVVQDEVNNVTANNNVDSASKNIDFKTFLSQWAIKEHILQSSLNSLLKGIKQYTCNNCNFNIPLNSRTLLRTPRSSNIEICAGGQYYHFGLREGILSILPLISQDITEIKISINIDGLPLSKSSQQQFWPILGSISDSKEVFIIGIYYGTHKPSDSNEFLAKFVDEVKILHEEGITVNNKNIPCTLHSIICDAPAKAFVLQIKGHNGYFSCTKCIIEGSYINGKMCFSETNTQLRTDKDFRLRKDENYHVGHSAILKLSEFDFVNNVPLDYMHLACLGVMRKLLYMWLFGKLEVRLQHRKVEKISSQLENVLKTYIPCEFVRKSRSLTFVKLWKATEFRNVLLYTGCVVFKLLRKDLYNHFLVLHVAIRILCCSEFHEYIDYAQELLEHFVLSFKLLYGACNVSHNVHGLIHLVQDAKRFGTLDTFSSFKYENYLQTLKKVLKKHNQPLQQVVRRYIERRNIEKPHDLHNITLSDFVIDRKSIHTKGPLIKGCCNPQYYIIKCSNATIRTDTLADNCCGLGDGTIVRIKNITYHKDLKTDVIIGNEFLHTEDLYDKPCPSSLLGIFVLDNLSDFKIWPVKDIKIKYVQLPFNNKFAIFPLLHL